MIYEVNWMKKTIFLFLLILIMNSNVFCAFAENDTADSWILCVDGKTIESENTVRYTDNQVLFPLRTIYEALGADIVWYDELHEMAINYDGTTYMAYMSFVSNDNIPIIRFRYLENGNDLLLISPLSRYCRYCNINGSIFIYEDSGRVLFEKMGCNVEIDQQNHILKID